MNSTATLRRPDMSAKRAMVLSEILRFALDSFRANRVRFSLTTLGMAIGTASLILVVTIGLTAKKVVMGAIESIGAHLIWAEYQGVGAAGQSTAVRDYLTIDDMRSIRAQIPGIHAASPVLNLYEPVNLPGGRKKTIQGRMLCVDPAYAEVRRLVIPAGRFFDPQDANARNKVAVLAQKLAIREYGSETAAVGQQIQIGGLPFLVLGTFRESVETFGQTEITAETILIPYLLAGYFTSTTAVNQLYFSMADAASVPRATQQILQLIRARHRPGSVYHVDNLSQVAAVASRVADALSLVLFLIAAVTLLIGGIGIMNIMLATVQSRVREIGVRKAIGATNHEIRSQFLAESVLISLSGGLIGVMVGIALPYSVQFLTGFHAPVSTLSIVLAVLVSSLHGIIFGTLPALRAASLDPVDSLRYE